MPAGSPLSSGRPRDWVDRNWKWFIPLLCAAGLACLFAFIALIVGLMKASDAYQGALCRIKTSPEAIATFGVPIKDGFFFTGNININGTTGRADLAIPISGPKGSATAYVLATKSLGAWHYTRLILVRTDDSAKHIDLSDPATQSPQPAIPSVP